MKRARYINDGSRTPGFRCGKCARLLAEGNEFKVEIRCDRCGELNFVLEQVSDMVIITDRKGKILFVNSAVQQVTGYTPSEVLGKNPSLWGGQMPREFYKKMWDTLLKQKQGVSVIVNNRHKSGRAYTALLQISPVLDTKGNIKFLVGLESVADPPPKKISQ